MSDTHRISRSTKPRSRTITASQSIVKWSWLVTFTAIFGGCASTPTQPDSPTPPSMPAGPGDSSGTSAAELAQRAGPKNDFHKSATERQRFQVHIDFGRVFEAQGNFDAAILEYQDALAVIDAKKQGRLKPVDEALAHRRMGGALDQLGRFAQAEVHYKKALKLCPKDARIWNDAGYSLYLQGRWAEAELTLKTAAKFAPEDERIRTNLGLTLAAAGRTEEALPLLSHTKGDAIGHMNLGYSLAATGQLDLARQQYETALAMRPDLDLARRALAKVDQQQSGASGAAPTPLIARNARTPGTPIIDPGVDQASAEPVPSRPPVPTRTAPRSKPNGTVSPPVEKSTASSIIEPPLPVLPASTPIPARP